MGTQIAYIICARPSAVDANAIVKSLLTRHRSVRAEAEPVGANPDVSFIQIDGVRVAIMNMGLPMPNDTSDWVWARAEKTWPEVKTVASRHGSHIIVAAFPETKSAIHSARALTAAVGAVLDAVAGCEGVVWGAEVARSAKVWRGESLAAFHDYPNYPLLLWVDVLPVGTPSGTEIMTVGLAAFTGREIEYPVNQPDLTPALNVVTGVACYLIEHGDVIKDGDTVGGSETERIVARHATSSNFNGMPVLRLLTGVAATLG